MECVLRVWGSNLKLNDVKDIISLDPYRVVKIGENRSSINCLYYDVVTQHDGTFSEALSKAFEWLKKANGIAKLKTRDDIDQINLDFGVFVSEEVMSSSYTISADFLRIAYDLGMSITISMYKVQK